MNKTVPLLLLLLCSAFPAAAQAISLPMTGTGALKEWSVRGCEAAPGREGITLKLSGSSAPCRSIACADGV